MAFTAKRATPFVFTDGQQVDVPLTRGMLDYGLLISVPYQDVITVGATATRIVATPIRQIQVLGEGGKVLHSISGVDAINKARVFELTPLAELTAPPTTLTAGTYTGIAHIPIMFAQPRAAGPNKDDTILPTYDYQNLVCRITCGSHTDVYRGGTGTLSATGTCTVTQLEAAGVPLTKANGTGIARRLRVSVDRPLTLVAPGVVSSKTKLEIGTQSDIRAIMITTEDANGDQTNVLFSALTLKEDNSTELYSGTLATAIRADNAKVYGAVMPTGVYLIDFCEDMDCDDPYRATQKLRLDAFFDFLAVNGNVRVNLITIEQPKAA